jgi:ankyrin repeat protein
MVNNPYPTHSSHIAVNRRFVDAVKKDDIPAALQALADGADPQVEAGKGMGNTLLHAASAGLGEMAAFLIAQGVEVHSTGMHGDSPLMRAAGRGDLSMVELLLRHGANPNWPGAEYCRSKRIEIPSLLPLHRACIAGHLAVVQTLLDHGADINVCAHIGGSALWYASANGHTDVACALVERGADPEAPFQPRNEKYTFLSGIPIPPARQYRTGLFSPVSQGDEEMVQLLLDAGASPDSRNQDGQTALESAGDMGRKTIGMQVLIERYARYPVFSESLLPQLRKADLFKPNADGYCLLDSPSTWRHFGAIRERLASVGEALSSADIDRRNPDGVSVLQRGIECFASEAMLPYCMDAAGRPSVQRLVSADGQATGVLKALVSRHHIHQLVDFDIWRGANPSEFRQFYNALPESVQQSMGNGHLLQLQLRMAQQQETQNGHGR